MLMEARACNARLEWVSSTHDTMVDQLPQLTKAVAKELGSRNVLANVVAPGFIDTEMTRALTEQQRTTLLAQIPLARLGEGRDVAGLVLFLASDLAGYITGQVFVVDGGMVM